MFESFACDFFVDGVEIEQTKSYMNWKIDGNG